MKRQEKVTTVENLTEQLKSAKSVILTDYRGLTVAQMSQLRSQVKKSGGELLVIKNTLLGRALKNLKLNLPDSELQGPTAVLITTGDDEMAPLKTVTAFTKANSLPNLKGGLWEDRAMTKAEIEKLSTLPGKGELLTKVTGVLKTPTARLVSVIANNPKKLIIILKQLQEKNGKPAETAEAVTPAPEPTVEQNVTEEKPSEAEAPVSEAAEAPEQGTEAPAEEAQVEQGQEEGGDTNNG